jgi:hypothetical protein
LYILYLINIKWNTIQSYKGYQNMIEKQF